MYFQDFFQDPHVRNNLKVLDNSGSWTLLGMYMVNDT